MIDKKTRAMIDTFRLFSSKNSKVSEPRVLKHITKFLFSAPTASIQKRLCRKSRAHKKVTIIREWKLMCRIMLSWIKLIYKQHSYFNLLAKAPRFCAKSRTRCYKLHKPGTVSVVSNLLYIRRKSELRFRFLLSCFLISSCWMNTAWLMPAKNTKRISITTTDITKITKKKVTEKDHIDHDVFEDEEVILQACEDSFMIQNFSSRLVTGQL